MLTERERKALIYYDRKAREGQVNDFPIWADSLQRRIWAGFPYNGALVDVGCGDGRFTKILWELGIDQNCYLGIDLSRAQVELARRLHPEYRFEIGNIYDLGKKHPERFDGFVCGAMLMLLPRERLQEALTSLRASLKPNALGFVSTPEGTGDKESAGNIVISLHEIDDLTEQFRKAGFDSELMLSGHMIIGWLQAS